MSWRLEQWKSQCRNSIFVSYALVISCFFSVGIVEVHFPLIMNRSWNQRSLCKSLFFLYESNTARHQHLLGHWSTFSSWFRELFALQKRMYGVYFHDVININQHLCSHISHFSYRRSFFYTSWYDFDEQPEHVFGSSSTSLLYLTGLAFVNSLSSS